MRRIAVILALGLSLIALVLILLLFRAPSAGAPEYVTAPTRTGWKYRSMNYDWSGAVPVRDGKVWIGAAAGATDRRIFLYDLRERAIVAELLNGSPLLFNGNQTKLLCEGRLGTVDSLRWAFSRWLQKQSWGRAWSQQMKHEQCFWVLDLKNKTATRVGKLSQKFGFGSSFVPSPGFRFAYNKASTSWGQPEFHLCDLQSNSMTKIRLEGEPKGWWNAQTILLKNDDGFRLLDALTLTTNMLFSLETISRKLDELALPKGSTDLDAFFSWNGRDFDCYFTLNKERAWGRAFLLKADKASGTLRLVDRDFQFQWQGRFDADGTHYLYPGESGAPGRGGNGAVYLRDLADNSVRTLVPPDHSGQYALARFCGEGVIYSRTNVVWWVDLAGSNGFPLLNLAKP